MKVKVTRFLASFALVVALAVVPGSASAQVKAKAGGYCELVNQKAGKNLYNGDCTIKQEVNGGSTTWTVKMGGQEPFVFTSSDGRHYSYKGQRARFQNGTNDGTFYWSDFKLYMRQETEARVSGGSSYSSGGGGVSLRSGSARCTLTNTSAGRQLYNGSCNVNQSSSQYSRYIFDIKMGSAESFKFAGDGNTWMSGPNKANYSDSGRGGTFTWSDFRLEVNE